MCIALERTNLEVTQDILEEVDIETRFDEGGDASDCGAGCGRGCSDDVHDNDKNQTVEEERDLDCVTSNSLKPVVRSSVRPSVRSSGKITFGPKGPF